MNFKRMENGIYPCLWFDGQAREAADFYCKVFKDARILTDNGLVVIFEIRNTKFMALNGGSKFKFNEAVSFVIDCDSQEQIDEYWSRLTEGGEESMCGWLKDKYGISWQVVPTGIGALLSDDEKAPAVMRELLKMKKINWLKLRNPG